MRALWQPDTLQPADLPVLNAIRTAWVQILAVSNGDQGLTDPIPGMDQVISMAMATGSSLGLPTAISLLGSVQQPATVSDQAQQMGSSLQATTHAHSDEASTRQSAIVPSQPGTRAGFKPVSSRASAQGSGLAALGRAASQEELHAAAGYQPAQGTSALASRSDLHSQPQSQDEQPSSEMAPDAANQGAEHDSTPASRRMAKRKADDLSENGMRDHDTSQDASDGEEDELEIDESGSSGGSQSDSENDDGDGSQSQDPE
jgi:hypothetical protein